MRLGLMRIAVGFALLLLSPLATAEDGGQGGGGADAAPAAPAPSAVLVDGAVLACDGSLCETQTGTTCAVAGVSPGRFSPSADGTFAILGLLVLASLARQYARERERPSRRAPEGNRGPSVGGTKRPLCLPSVGQCAPPTVAAKNGVEKVTISMGFYKRLCR